AIIPTAPFVCLCPVCLVLVVLPPQTPTLCPYTTLFRSMNALRRAWETEYGAGTVVGLAPSAVAAEVLAEDLGIATEIFSENFCEIGRAHVWTPGTFRSRMPSSA